MNAHAVGKALGRIQARKYQLVERSYDDVSSTYRAELRLQYEELLCREDELIMQATELLDFHEREVQALREILGEDK